MIKRGISFCFRYEPEFQGLKLPAPQGNGDLAKLSTSGLHFISDQPCSSGIWGLGRECQGAFWGEEKKITSSQSTDTFRFKSKCYIVWHWGNIREGSERKKIFCWLVWLETFKDPLTLWYTALGKIPKLQRWPSEGSFNCFSQSSGYPSCNSKIPSTQHPGGLKPWCLLFWGQVVLLFFTNWEALETRGL